MRVVVLFVLAVIVAVAIALMVPQFVFREPAGYAYLYFRVAPSGNGVAVWIEDLAGYKPNRVFWRVNGAAVGWKSPGEKISVNCGDYVEALVAYSFGQRAVAGRIACAPRFKLPQVTVFQDAAINTVDHSVQYNARRAFLPRRELYSSPEGICASGAAG